MRAFELPVEDLRLIRLTHVDPLLPTNPYVLYEYTIPHLTNRAMNALRRRCGDSQPVYTGYKGPVKKNDALEEQYIEPLEAARLVSGIYSHFLDPLRFGGTNPNQSERDEIFNGFVRTLAGSRVLPSVELVAANMPILRTLDEFQDGLGTNVARWMQYLAFEALETNIVQRGFTTGRELERLRTALYAMRDSSTILDRFRALGRDPWEGRT
jgi:hypothetical protein